MLREGEGDGVLIGCTDDDSGAPALPRSYSCFWLSGVPKLKRAVEFKYAPLLLRSHNSTAAVNVGE
eukprot:6476321-Amphidinium_carterae.1